jgi:hypothetical protein
VVDGEWREGHDQASEQGLFWLSVEAEGVEP